MVEEGLLDRRERGRWWRMDGARYEFHQIVSQKNPAVGGQGGWMARLFCFFKSTSVFSTSNGVILPPCLMSSNVIFRSETQWCESLRDPRTQPNVQKETSLSMGVGTPRYGLHIQIVPRAVRAVSPSSACRDPCRDQCRDQCRGNSRSPVAIQRSITHGTSYSIVS